MSELALSELMERFDADQSGTIDFTEFEQVLEEIKPKEEAENASNWGSWGKKLMKALNPSDVKRKLALARQLSDVKWVESLNICSSEATRLYAGSSWADLTFAIFIKGAKEPLIVVCSKPEQRQAWIDALCICIVNSIKFGSDASLRELFTSFVHLCFRWWYAMTIKDCSRKSTSFRPESQSTIMMSITASLLCITQSYWIAWILQACCLEVGQRLTPKTTRRRRRWTMVSTKSCC